MSRSRRLACALSALALAASARAQGEVDLAGDEEVEVSSRTPLTSRDAPGVVTVVHRDEIEAAGVRDLLDLLLLVPGFAPGLDVGGVVDVGFRGLWGHEGKVLFLLDGQELNETLYSTMQLGGRIPIDLVERVEIVRGPGSAVYGGNAELAVVHVYTRRPQDLSGGAARISAGRMGEGFGHASATASWGGAISGASGLALSLNLGHSESVRSDGTYRDFAGDSYAMRPDSGLSDTLLSLGLQAGGLRLRAVYDDYRLRSRDGYDAVLPATETVRFESTLLEARYEAKFASGVTLTPRLAYRRYTPWQTTLDSTSPLFYDKTADRYLGGLTLGWEGSAGRLLVGFEAFFDRARVGDLRQLDLGFGFGPDGTDTTNNSRTASGFAQLLWRTSLANLHLGARYEHSTASGGAFVPRVGLTRVLGRLHWKLLYSRAFRAPAIENINSNPDIQPERTDVVEAEVGLQLGGHVALLANGFWIRIQKPIVFTTVANTDIYANGGKTGSSGLEAQVRARYAWGFANLGYSFYTADGQNDVELYAVPGKSALLFGFPAHKATLAAGLHLGPKATLGASAVLLGPRSGNVAGDGSGNPVIGTEPAALLLGGALTYRDFPARGLSLSLGIRNLLDERHRVLQPFAASHAPLPMGGREVTVRLGLDQAAFAP